MLGEVFESTSLLLRFIIIIIINKMLYSLTARLNYIIYNVMSLLAFVGLMNHVTIKYGHLVGLRNVPIGLPKEAINF